MEITNITSLEQVPEGLTLLLKKVADIETKISTPPQPIQQPSKTDTLCTRMETARRLNITLATLNQYTKTGKIIAHRVGNRVLYKETDIQNALSQVRTSKR